MDMIVMIGTGIIICLAGAVQSAVGFGYALFATPLLVWIGMPLPSVIMLVATCSMIQAIIGSVKLRRSVPWRLSTIATLVRLAGVVAGLMLLKRLVKLDTNDVRLMIGCILCLLVAVQFAWRPKPVKTMHWTLSTLAFLAGGFLSGLCGMGGPPLVLWAMAHDWSSIKIRSFLFTVFAASMPFQIFLLSATFGRDILWNAAIGIACLPLVYLGSAIGMPVGNRMGRNRLRHIAYAVLFIIGSSAVISALIARLN